MGTYNTARRPLFTYYNGLSVVGRSWRVQRIDGALRGARGRLRARRTALHFAADFEQHRENAGPGLFGAIRYNSTIASLQPFGGAYPRYQLTVSVRSSA